MPAEWVLPLTNEAGAFAQYGAKTVVCIETGTNAQIIEQVLQYQRDDLLKTLSYTNKRQQAEELVIVVPARKKLIRNLTDEDVQKIVGTVRYAKSGFINFMLTKIPAIPELNPNTPLYLTDIRSKFAVKRNGKR